MEKVISLVGFKTAKAAQIAAYFATRCDEQKIEKLKLMKLIYLAEREFLGTHGHPMLYDEFFSLPHGPICSSTLYGVNGQLDWNIWSQYISRAKDNKTIKARKKFDRDDLDEISDSEIEALEITWERFGWMTAGQVRNYTHKNCAEYTETSGRIPISYKEVFVALGIQDAEHLDEEISTFRRSQGVLAGK